MTAVVESGSRSRHRDSPRVRRLAREAGVDLSTLQPTGAHGRATPDDVAAAARPGDPGATSHTPGAAPAGTVIEVDLTAVLRAGGAGGGVLAEGGLSSTSVACVAEALARELASHPGLAGRPGAGSSSRPGPDDVPLGVAVETGDGLLVPIVRRAADLTVAGLARRLEDLSARAQDGELPADQLAEDAFVLVDGSGLGTLFETGVVMPGQAAVLAVGSVVRRSVAVSRDGQERLAIRSMAHLSLAYDPLRVSRSGAARFLTSVRDRLEATDTTGG